MKRFLCLFLSVLFLLPGCSNMYEEENTTVFYYCRTSFIYGDVNGVIASENRDISKNTSDLKNTLALYLVGPVDEELTSPFVGTQLLSAKELGGHLLIILADTEKEITDADFSLASACLAMTCLELMDLDQVSITCAERSATMHRDNLLLYDYITSTEITSEDPQ